MAFLLGLHKRDMSANRSPFKLSRISFSQDDRHDSDDNSRYGDHPYSHHLPIYRRQIKRHRYLP
jgi:hypothetical protein